MSSSSTRLSTPEGPGSVSGAPNLPAGFTDTFTSRYIDAGGLRQHEVIGGDGPPLLLVHGWPENWYAWRLLMPALARNFEVIAFDQRGIGLTYKPQDGYDTGPPGAVPAPPLFVSEPINNRLWHIPFNRVKDKLTEELVRGREDVFFGYEYAIQGGKPLPDDALRYDFSLFSDPEVLRGSFGFYRAMQLLADDVQSVVISGAGHWVAEQAPEELLAALTGFLAPYRDRG